MKLRPSKALSFDDILLVPQYSDIKSRLDVSLRTKLTTNVELDIPVTSSNMSTVTEHKMLVTMDKLGGIGFLHRFIDIKTQIEEVHKAKNLGCKKFVLSVGVKEEDYNNLDVLVSLGPSALLIDIANGDSKAAYEILKFIKSHYKIDVILGNITTVEAAQRAEDLGADAVRLGVGPGSVCSTRVVTGHGYPLLQAVLDLYQSSVSIPVIADGGIKRSGDAVKALAAGASTVCLGSLLARTSDSPGPILKMNGEEFKEIYGMSSTRAMEKYKNGKRTGIAAEGVDLLVPYSGPSESFLNEFCGGIRSGLTYSGARTIKELQQKSEYVVLTPGSIKESKH